MKRILHIIGAMNRAGAETMVMNLYRVLDKTQYQFDFVYFTEEKCDFDEEILALGGKIYRLPLSNFAGRTWAMFRFLYSNKHFHAIHSHMFLNIGFDFTAAYFAGYRNLIAHSHNTSNSTSSSIIQTIYALFSKVLINLFTKTYLACGREAGDYLFYKNKQVIVLPNAIDFEVFRKNTTSHNLRNSFSCNENTLLMCQIGRFLEVKNHIFSLKLAHYMKQQNIDFQLLYIGTGLLEKEIQKTVIELQVSDVVHFLGLRSDIPDVLIQCDVMLMPSIHEGFPVVLVESQVAGIPALISDSIAKEVDLGVDLVFFESLSADFSIWTNQLLHMKSKKKFHDKTHLELIKEKGFDSNDNAKKLIKIYNL